MPEKPRSRLRRILRALLILAALLFLTILVYVGCRAWTYGDTKDLPIEAWHPSGAVGWARIKDAYGTWTRAIETPMYTGPRGSQALEELVAAQMSAQAPENRELAKKVFTWFDADTLLREFGADAFVAIRPSTAGAKAPPELFAVTRLPFRYYCIEPFVALGGVAGIDVTSSTVRDRTVRKIKLAPDATVWTCSTGDCIAVSTSEELMKQAVDSAFGGASGKIVDTTLLPDPVENEICHFGIELGALPNGSPARNDWQKFVRQIPIAELLHPTDPDAIQRISGSLALASDGLKIDVTVRTALDRASPRIRAQHNLPAGPPSALSRIPAHPVFVETLRTDVAGSWDWTRETIVRVIQREGYNPSIGDPVKAIYGLLNAFLEPFDREGVNSQIFPYLGPDFVITLAPGSEERSGRRPLLVLGLMTQLREPLLALPALDEFIRKVGQTDPGGALSLETMVVGPYEVHLLKTHFEKFGELCYGVIDDWLVVTSSIDYFTEFVHTRLGDSPSAGTEEEITRAAAEARTNGTHCFVHVRGDGVRRTLLDFREEASRILTDRIDRRALRGRIEAELSARGQPRGREFDEMVDERVQQAVEQEQIKARREVEKTAQSIEWFQSAAVSYRIQGPVGRCVAHIKFNTPKSRR